MECLLFYKILYNDFMKLRLTYLIPFLLFLGFSFSQAPSPILQAKESVFYLYKNGEFQCTAFAASRSLIYTAGHCVLERNAAYTVTQDREKFFTTKVISVRYTALNDVALLSVDNLEMKPLYLCKEFPKQGDTLWVWGSPLGFDLLLRTGIYSGELTYSSVFKGLYKNAFMTTINGDRGISGAPVLTDKGCYVGLATNIISVEFKLDGVVFRKVL